jgi:hypothetical protein
VKTLCVALAFILGLTAPLASAQEVSVGEDIVVSGRDLREAARAFVGEIAASSPGADQMARWDRAVCPGVVGLRDGAQARFVADRIGQRAVSVDLRAPDPGCRPNIWVFFTNEAGELAETLASEYRDFVGYHGNVANVTMGREALQAFVETDRPVRWWHVSQTISADGEALGEPDPAGSEGVNGIPVTRTYGGRLRGNTRQDLSRVVVIVDVDGLDGMRLDALADYIAMVSLAQVSTAADTSQIPTILNLFSGAGSGALAPTEMSDWDVAYLRALYDTTRNARNVDSQERDMARRMAAVLDSPPPTN